MNDGFAQPFTLDNSGMAAWPPQHALAHSLIVGGQKSGKSRYAEAAAAAWLGKPAHQASLIATAQAWDEEMQERIAKHQADRRVHVPSLQTLEEPKQLAQAIATHSRPAHLLVIDCLTLWLTNWLMPMALSDVDEPIALRTRRGQFQAAKAALIKALQAAPGPVLLVSNEMGWGVMPMGRAVRAFADELGLLNQAVAAVCPRVVLLVAGQALDVKALGSYQAPRQAGCHVQHQGEY